MSGLPCGFMTDWDSLPVSQALRPIVLPSLAEAPKAVEHIRRLYNQGVSLFAVSRVDGLEDIFGVKPSSENRVNVSDTIGNSEYILPLDAELTIAGRRGSYDTPETNR